VTKPCWREESDSDSVTFFLRFQMSQGWSMLAGGVGGSIGGIARGMLGQGFDLGEAVLTSAVGVLLVYTAGGMFAETRIRLDRHLLTVTMGLRKRARVRLPITAIDHFAIGRAPQRWFSIEAITVDGDYQSCAVSLRKREQAEALVARLDAALAQVRAPGRYRD
jgi:hypothetical protein